MSDKKVPWKIVTEVEPVATGQPEAHQLAVAVSEQVEIERRRPAAVGELEQSK